jgi:hypothetical protein
VTKQTEDREEDAMKPMAVAPAGLNPPSDCHEERCDGHEDDDESSGNPEQTEIVQFHCELSE